MGQKVSHLMGQKAAEATAASTFSADDDVVLRRPEMAATNLHLRDSHLSRVG